MLLNDWKNLTSGDSFFLHALWIRSVCFSFLFHTDGYLFTSRYIYIFFSPFVTLLRIVTTGVFELHGNFYTMIGKIWFLLFFFLWDNHCTGLALFCIFMNTLFLVSGSSLTPRQKFNLKGKNRKSGYSIREYPIHFSSRTKRVEENRLVDTSMIKSVDVGFQSLRTRNERRAVQAESCLRKELTIVARYTILFHVKRRLSLSWLHAVSAAEGFRGSNEIIPEAVVLSGGKYHQTLVRGKGGANDIIELDTLPIC